VWGGRGRGGRGVQKRDIYGKVDNIIVEGVTVAYDGNSLLERSRLQICKGRRYALIGKNGCGKSTLLRRIATKSLPGFQLSVRIGYVPQELEFITPDGKGKESCTMCNNTRRIIHARIHVPLHLVLLAEV